MRSLSFPFLMSYLLASFVCPPALASITAARVQRLNAVEPETPSVVGISNDTNSTNLRNSGQDATTICAGCMDCADMPDINYSDASDFDSTNSIEDGNDYKKRATAHHSHLKRREWGGGTATIVGKVLHGPPCFVDPYIPKPRYPGAKDIWRADTGTKVQRAVYGRFFTTAKIWAVPVFSSNKCDAPGWAYMSSDDIVQPQIGPKGTTDTDITSPWQIGGDDKIKKKVNVDHVYELSVLDEFFAWQITPGYTACPNVKKLYDMPFPQTDGSRATTLNFIFSQLASFSELQSIPAQPDFIGMDGGLNKVKGSLWNLGLSHFPIILPDPTRQKKVLGQVALVMRIVNEPRAVKLWQNTHGRLYKAFQRVDKAIRDGLKSKNPKCKAMWQDTAGQNFSPTWAAEYSRYIVAKITTQNALIQTKVASIISNIPTDPARAPASSLAPGYRENARWVADFDKKYPVAQMTFPPATNWPALNLQGDGNENGDLDVDGCPFDGTNAIGIIQTASPSIEYDSPERMSITPIPTSTLIPSLRK